MPMDLIGKIKKLQDFNGNASLRSRIKRYQILARELQQLLKDKPYEWGKYQNVFNRELDNVFRLIMDYEKNNLSEGHPEKVKKLHKIFVKYIRKEFLHGEYIVWSLKKPYGYAGDFKIIDAIYQNEPATTGFDRLFDNYFQMSSISVAVRNRKEDFKQIIKNVISKKNKARILDLGSGPGRDLLEVLLDQPHKKSISVDCVDNDPHALDYSKKLLLNANSKIEFIRQNVLKLAATKHVHKLFPHQYDLIYSTGLFDYFSDRVIEALIKNLKQLLARDGLIAISDVRDKFSNPSVHFMEWVGDWSLVYRHDEGFRNLFIKAGFRPRDLTISYEQQGIMQYVVGCNT